ncbi:hypothetical protein [Aurantiacibacter suaedae]|uniref:hypothetical protein n=1 Tax=Aurantiacibacter suaedae TaxID=2545755 RepID=UPI0010F74A9B|nr:hypothetical protein [Aurantiacibacter suaedae]
MNSGNHFADIKSWLDNQNLARDEVHGLLDRYREQHEGPFVESNRFFVASMIFSALFFLKYFGIDFNIKIFELDFVDIPNSYFFFPLFSIVCFSYAALRAADATYYQHLIKLISKIKLGDREKVIARGYFGGAMISGNVIDVWKSLPGSGFKFWYLAFATTSGAVILAVCLIPYVTGFFFLFSVEPIGTETEVLVQRLVMVFFLVAAISCGGYALAMQSLDSALEEAVV